MMMHGVGFVKLMRSDKTQAQSDKLTPDMKVA